MSLSYSVRFAVVVIGVFFGVLAFLSLNQQYNQMVTSKSPVIRHVDSKGRSVVVATRAFDESLKSDLIIMRFETGGSLDKSFGTNGIAEIPLKETWDLKKILYSGEGYYFIGHTGDSPVARNGIRVLKLDEKGKPFKNFSRGGTWGMSLPGKQIYTVDSKLDPIGRLIVSFTVDGQRELASTSNAQMVLRLLANGQLDRSFAEIGYKSAR